MKLLVDENLSIRVAGMLRGAGQDATSLPSDWAARTMR
jgi:predicted nuclease of predicted toxin-antitoxin system